MMSEKVRIKYNAGNIYAAYLIKEVFSHPVEFNTAYEEQEKLHWLHDHAGMIGDGYEENFNPDEVIVVTVNGGIPIIIPKWCVEKFRGKNED
jgi:hypothetical protein